VRSEQRNTADRSRDPQDQRHWTDPDQSYEGEDKQQTSRARRHLGEDDDLPTEFCGTGQCVDLGFEVGYFLTQVRHLEPC